MEKLEVLLDNIDALAKAQLAGSKVVYVLELVISSNPSNMCLFRYAGIGWMLYPSRSDDPFPFRCYATEQEAETEKKCLIEANNGPYFQALESPELVFRIVEIVF